VSLSFVLNGELHVNVQYNNQRTNLDLYVVRKGEPPLFGREWLHHFQLNWKKRKSLKILKSKSTTLSDDLFLCQV
jgi:hypothetical protein